MTVMLFAAWPPAAIGQQSVSDVLSLLLTNQTIQTQDFVRDQQAAAATRDTISGLLLLDLVTLPVSSSSGGFTYRFNRALGTVERQLRPLFYRAFADRRRASNRIRTELSKRQLRLTRWAQPPRWHARLNREQVSRSGASFRC
jgi:hypothetical protein